MSGVVQIGQSIKERRGEYLSDAIKLEYGVPWLMAPYGDDSLDQFWIQQGIDYFSAPRATPQPLP
jgi:hypothetical protein